MSQGVDDSKEEKELFGLQIGKFGRRWILGMCIALILLITTYAWWFGYKHGFYLSNDPEKWAQFGDFVAGVAGPFIGFISIIFVLETLNLQRKQITQATEEMAKQNGILNKQAMEQTFFSWCQAYKNQLSIIKYSNGRAAKTTVGDGVKIEVKNEFQGMEALSYVARKIKEEEVPDNAKMEAADRARNDMIFLFEKYASKDGFQIKSAIRTLYVLIRWIDSHESLSDRERWFYVSILRSQLTDDEMLFLFVNGLTLRGKKFVDFSNKYALFDNFDWGDVKRVVEAMKENYAMPYSNSAFQSHAAQRSMGI